MITKLFPRKNLWYFDCLQTQNTLRVSLNFHVTFTVFLEEYLFKTEISILKALSE